jgi:hypothetical protein
LSRFVILAGRSSSNPIFPFAFSPDRSYALPQS